jgi:two-component system LytT family response regulator
MTTALLADDEPHLARGLAAELGVLWPELQIVHVARHGLEAAERIAALEPDLAFLDIQMPGLTGLEVAQGIEVRTRVVFVTAYDEFALKAFEVHAVDYLLKPVEPARLAEAIERAAARLALAQALPAGPALRPSAVAVAATARPPGRPLERVLIREEGRVHVLPLGKIDFVEAKDDYLSFAVAGKRLQKQQTMAELEAQLDGGRFVRVHRSYLLNIDRLARLELYAKDSWIAILADGTRIPVSRSGHARLKELLG